MAGKTVVKWNWKNINLYLRFDDGVNEMVEEAAQEVAEIAETLITVDDENEYFRDKVSAVLHDFPSRRAVGVVRLGGGEAGKLNAAQFEAKYKPLQTAIRGAASGGGKK